MSEFLILFWGSILYRPYVYAFLIAYLFFSVYQLGWKRASLFLFLTYMIAFLAEFSSTRNGFPFGIYTYIETTRTRELWISNVPFWDSLSFVFLSYFSFQVSAWIVGVKSWKAPVVGGLLMMLLDIIIDPVALRGEHWFLGKVYFYPNGGSYFGVTIANFIGWFVVGFFSQWLFQVLGFWKSVRPLSEKFFVGAFGTYSAVFIFNLLMTAWIGEYLIFFTGLLIAGATLATVLFLKSRSTGFRFNLANSGEILS